MTKAELEQENARLRGEVETLRYKLRLMSDAMGHGNEAMRCSLKAQSCYNEIVMLDLAPTTLND